jgi:hypothetical protein
MAARFWVGGAGTWDAATTTNWSATTGGAGGASAPTTSDDATFDANSGSGTCTTAAGSTCRNTTLNSSTLLLTLGANHTQVGSFTHTQGIVNLVSFTFTSTNLVSSNSNARTLAFGTGKWVLSGSNSTVLNTGTFTGLTVSGSKNIEFSYAGAVGTRTITMASIGAGNTEAFALNLSFLSGTDTITFSSGRAFGNINFNGFAGTTTAVAFTVFGDFVLSSGMTYNGGTGVLTMAATSGTKTITSNNKTIDQPITFNGVSGTFAFQDALTQGSTRAFTITNGTVQLKAGTTSTVGAFATSGTNQKFLQSTLAGSQATLSQVSGTVSASYLTIKDINANGGATWNAFATNNNVNAGNNLGWDFAVQLGRYIYTVRKNKRILF